MSSAVPPDSSSAHQECGLVPEAVEELAFTASHQIFHICQLSPLSGETGSKIDVYGGLPNSPWGLTCRTSGNSSDSILQDLLPQDLAS
jgi:hypothetical protein